jgi:tryptophan-rich sensory protein
MANLKPVQPEPIVRESNSRGAQLFLWIFSIAMIVTAGSAFGMKLIDFYVTATREGTAAMGSFLIPVMNYLFVAAGFAALFVWAYSRGQFRNVEAPKYRMLEQNALCDEEWERTR